MKSLLSVLALVVVLTICNSCGKQIEQEGEAPTSSNESLESRLIKSEEIRVRLGGVRKAVRSLDTILGDLASALNSHPTIQGKPAEKTQTYFDLFQKLLKQGAEGLVQFESDGSWVLERALPELGKALSCPTVRTRIVGRGEKGSEELRVFLVDCSNPQKLHQLLEAKLIDADEVTIEINPNVFGNLTKQEVSSNQCEVKMSKNRTEIHCRPIKVEMGDATVVFSPVDVVETPAGLLATIEARATDSKGKEILFVGLDQKPGKEPKINLIVR